MDMDTMTAQKMCFGVEVCFCAMYCQPCKLVCEQKVLKFSTVAFKQKGCFGLLSFFRFLRRDFLLFKKSLRELTPQASVPVVVVVVVVHVVTKLFPTFFVSSIADVEFGDKLLSKMWGSLSSGNQPMLDPNLDPFPLKFRAGTELSESNMLAPRLTGIWPLSNATTFGVDEASSKKKNLPETEIEMQWWNWFKVQY